MANPEYRAQVNLYTDGACEPNPGSGGWAFVLVHVQSGKRIEESGMETNTTNNRMEIIAAIRGLEKLKFSCEVTLYSDSQYLIMGLNRWLDDWLSTGRLRPKGIHSSVANPDLWWKLDELRRIHRIVPIKVKGHSGTVPEQELCDKLSYAAIRKGYKKTSPGSRPPEF